MSYQKKSKDNLFAHLRQNVKDSNNGLKIMVCESSTFRRIYPIMIASTLVLDMLFDFIMLEYVILVALFILDSITETMNTAVEEACDSITTDYDWHIKRSKDIASAAVYITHLCYITAAVFFAIAHAVNFEWWSALIPA